MGAAHPTKANRPHVVDHHIRLQGADGADLTIEEGSFIKSVTRQGEGVYRISWQQDPGVFLDARYGLQAATMTDLKGHTVVFDTYDATNFQLDFTLFSAADTADDLLVNEYLGLVISFSEHGV